MKRPCPSDPPLLPSPASPATIPVCKFRTYVPPAARSAMHKARRRRHPLRPASVRPPLLPTQAQPPLPSACASRPYDQGTAGSPPPAHQPAIGAHTSNGTKRDEMGPAAKFPPPTTRKRACSALSQQNFSRKTGANGKNWEPVGKFQSHPSHSPAHLPSPRPVRHRIGPPIRRAPGLTPNVRNCPGHREIPPASGPRRSAIAHTRHSHLNATAPFLDAPSPHPID